MAFGLVSGDAPDRFIVALATLSLLAEVALKRPCFGSSMTDGGSMP
ncbi:MAG: hypothetical protein ACLP50_31415 [Solirubrobacteraceae bacterium]